MDNKMLVKDIPDYKDIKPDSEDDRVAPLSEVAEENRKNNNTGDRYSTGFKRFDDALKGGFADGDFNVIAGIQQSGKTSFAQTITYHLCKQAIPCLWFSYETVIEELDTKFKNMGIDENYLVYTPFKNTSHRLDWIKDKIKEGVAKYSTKVVFIDHIGKLVSQKAERSGNKSQFLDAIASELKDLALELRIVIVTMSHISRTGDNVPTVQDIYYSSGIGNEATAVMIIWRLKNESKTSLKLGEDKTEDDDEEYSNETRVKLGKARPTGHTPILKFIYKNDRFSLIDNQHEDDEYIPSQKND